MHVQVSGGTGAGSKRPLREPRRTPWTCSRDHQNPPYATRCLTFSCNERRPR